MKLKYFWILLLFVSCSKKDCFEFYELNWCLENVERSDVSDKYLIVSNNKDGLNFEARVTSNCENNFKENIKYPDSFTVTKGDLTFDVFYYQEKLSLTYSNIIVLKGMAFAENDEKQVCVEWQGVNKKKALRLINQLLGE